jgi:hypothetical protein
MDVSQSRRSDNVIDYRGTDTASLVRSDELLAQQLAEQTQTQRFRAKLLVTGLAAFLVYVMLRERGWI